MTPEAQLLKAASDVLSHWEGRDCGAGWIKPLRAAVERMENCGKAFVPDSLSCPRCNVPSGVRHLPGCRWEGLIFTPIHEETFAEAEADTSRCPECGFTFSYGHAPNCSHRTLDYR